MTHFKIRRQLLSGLPNPDINWIGRPGIDIGLSFYIRIFGLRTLKTIQNHDFSKKAVMNPDLFNSLCSGGDMPTWEEFKSEYSDFFDFKEDNAFTPCPGQQSLENVMENNEPEKVPATVEKDEPGSVYGDTPNHIKQQPITFADMFNRSAQPFEIDGKLYRPRLELLDVDRD